jgi:hypothetical protein
MTYLNKYKKWINIFSNCLLLIIFIYILNLPITPNNKFKSTHYIYLIVLLFLFIIYYQIY